MEERKHLALSTACLYRFDKSVCGPSLPTFAAQLESYAHIFDFVLMDATEIQDDYSKKA